MSDVFQSTRDGVQVLGLCRFSVPARGGFQQSTGWNVDRQDKLYDPARMAMRFAWFETVCLPSIAAQRDPDFKVVVMLGEAMPEPWRARIEGHIAAHPQLVAAYVPVGAHRPLCAEVMARHMDPNADVVAQFRLDDDDAVAIDYVRAIREDFDRFRSLLDDTDAFALNYTKGLILEDQGHRIALHANLGLFLSCGQTIFTRRGAEKYVLDYVHNNIWQEMPTVTVPEEFMYVRGEHAENDSGKNRLGKNLRLARGTLKADLARRFRIHLKDVRRALDAARAEFGPTPSQSGDQSSKR